MKSTAGFILALIGGITSILGSVGFLAQSIVFYWASSSITSGVEQMGGTVENNLGILPLVIGISVFLWLLIMGILAIIVGVKMNKDDSALVKKGGIMALIVGILSFNLFTIIGGVIGMIQSKNQGQSAPLGGMQSVPTQPVQN